MNKFYRYLPILLISIFLVIIYFPTFSLYLMGDDFEILNDSYKVLRHPLAVFDSVNNFFRPFTKISLLLNYILFRTDAKYYILTTVSLHIINTGLLYAFLLSATQRKFFAVGVALFWGTSPLYSEVTLWASSRSDSLVLLFGLSCLLLLVRFPYKMPVVYRFCALLLMICAACSKENWFIFPFLIIGYRTILLKQSFKQAIHCQQFELGLLFGYGILFFLGPVLTHTRPITGYAPLTIQGMFTKFSVLLCRYAWMEGVFTNALWQRLLLICVVVVCLGTMVRLRNRLALWGGLWMVGALVPTIAIQYASSRFNYLPLVGFWIMVVAFFEQLYSLVMQRAKRLQYYGCISVSLLCFFGICYQCILVRNGIEDYRFYTDAHKMLVSMYKRVTPPIPQDYPLIFINKGSWRPIREALKMAQGSPEMLFVRGKGLWELIYFDDLVNFVTHSFRTMLVPVHGDIQVLLQSPCLTIIFHDQGFSITRNDIYRTELLKLYNIHQRLPDNVGIFQFVNL